MAPGNSSADQAQNTKNGSQTRKKPKTTPSNPTGIHIHHGKITQIPLEILAEILSYTTPREILSLARANKYFCATLVNNPSTLFIWKRARKCFKPKPIPDPTSNFTEASYAALLFDTGKCEVCGKKTKKMLHSFTVRVRLCEQDVCLTKLENTMVKGTDVLTHIGIAHDPGLYRQVLLAIPRLEASARNRFLYRRAEWREAVDQCNKAALEPTTLQKYKEELKRAQRRVEAITEFGKSLVKWKDTYEQTYASIRAQNIGATKIFASKQGWQFNHLMQCPTYHDLYRRKIVDLDIVLDKDFLQIRDQVKGEMAAIDETKNRRAAEEAFQKRREELTSKYNRLVEVAHTRAEVIPTLSEFRKLPIVERVQKIVPETSVSAQELKSSKFIDGLIKEDVVQWREKAKASLIGVLGNPSGDSNRASYLDPIKRLTARFRCKKCDARIVDRQDDSGMSFAEACEHECKGGSKKAKKATWKPERFVPDQKAIDAIRQLLMWCGYDEDDAITVDIPREVGSRILCTSCPAETLMSYDILLRHCRRHESMKLKLLSVEEVDKIMKHPIEAGLCAKLMDRSQQKARVQRIYGCRHCEQGPLGQTNEPSEVVADAAQNTSSAPEASHMPNTSTSADTSNNPPTKARGSRVKAGDPKKLPKLLTFDGLRSHVKEKHGIRCIGDEDFFRLVQDEKLLKVLEF